MEKQRIITITKFCRRLLICAAIFCANKTILFSQTLSYSEIQQLRIKPAENQQLYTKTEIKFELYIPKVSASDVQVISTQQKSEVSFKSMRKSEDYERGGTQIELWYSFEKSETYHLDAAQILINNKRRNIKFETFTILDDPSKQSPRIVIVFDNGEKIYSDHGVYSSPVFTANVGEKIGFTVNLQYATQLVQFSWDIPKDSIFKQTETYEITEVKYREKNYTHDLIPVASFEWTALTTGAQPMAKIKLTATGYNGYRNELLLPEVQINFVEKAAASKNSLNDKLFNDAFTEIPVYIPSVTTSDVSLEDCQKLAECYSKERHSIFTHYFKQKERKAFEHSLGLPVNSNRDFSVGQLYGALLLFIGAIILLILSIIEKKGFRVLISTTLMLCATVPFIYSIIKATDDYGICTGCTITAVPESNTDASSEVTAGNKVLIKEETENWYYIELGDSCGWCSKNDIILIK